MNKGNIIPIYPQGDKTMPYVPVLFPKLKGGYHLQYMRRDKLKNDPRVIPTARQLMAVTDGN